MTDVELKNENGMCLHTKEDLIEMGNAELYKLIDFAGGKVHLAKMLGCATPTIHSCLTRGLLSEELARRVDIHSRLNQYFSFKSLRPDLNV